MGARGIGCPYGVGRENVEAAVILEQREAGREERDRRPAQKEHPATESHV